LAQRGWRKEGKDGGIDVESLLMDTRGQSRIEALCQTQGNTVGVREIFKARWRRVEGLVQAGQKGNVIGPFLLGTVEG
jgi:hypothetical protein